MKVICDTNIWYGIGSGAISPEAFEGYDLICTHVSLNELSRTYNLIVDYPSVQRAVLAIKTYSKGFIWVNPFEYSLSKLDQNYKYETTNTNGEDLWKNIQKVLTTQVTIPTDKVQEMKYLYTNLNKDFNDEMTSYNTLADKVKLYVKENHLKNKRRAEDISYQTKSFLAFLFNGYVEQHAKSNIVNITPELSSWANLELLVQAMSDFFKEVELSPTKRIKGNDWGDIFNLAYADTDALYWTNEKTWKRFIELNPKTTNYLFQPYLIPNE